MTDVLGEITLGNTVRDSQRAALLRGLVAFIRGEHDEPDRVCQAVALKLLVDLEP